jgi:hypothetical protein
MSKSPVEYSNFTQSAPTYRMPTKNNPMMNVPITSYDAPQNYNDYYRYAEMPNKAVMNAPVMANVQNEVTHGLYQDPADMFFQRNNSQRQWYSMPNGSVPNDQSAFAENLYGRDFVCKSGSIWARHDIAYSDDSLACTGFEGDGQVTNFGRLNRN